MASAVDQSTPGSCKKVKANSDSTPLSGIDSLVAKSADEKKAQVEVIPLPAAKVQVPVLPSASDVAVDQSSPSSNKKRSLDSSQILKLL